MYWFIINLKTYHESTGKRAIAIAKACKELEVKANSKGVEIILCPQEIDLRDVSRVGVKVYSQHIDTKEPGQTTGFNVPRNFKEAGAFGTLISHSEHRLPVHEIAEALEYAKEAGLESCVCARDVQRVQSVAHLRPRFIAVEPMELIGGDISISTAQPELITDSINASHGIDILVGAGIKTTEDVRKSIELGAKGILVASGVAKAKNPKEEIDKLLDGF